MATSPDTPALTLTPPEPVAAIAPAQAAGLVPLTPETGAKLDSKVEAFISDLVAQDANSP